MKLEYILIAGIVVFTAAILLMRREGKSSGYNNPSEEMTDDDIRNLAKQGRKIEAIKLYRMIHQVSLKDAKNGVEKML